MWFIRLGRNDSACYKVPKPVPKSDDYHNKLRVWLRYIRYGRRIVQDKNILITTILEIVPINPNSFLLMFCKNLLS